MNQKKTIKKIVMAIVVIIHCTSIRSMDNGLQNALVTIGSLAIPSCCNHLYKLYEKGKGYYGLYVNDRLLVATTKGRVKNIEFWLKWGASLEARDKGYKWTPLQFALNNKEYAAAEFLLKSGANVHSVETPISPLTMAINRNDRQMLKLLLHYKIDVNKNISGSVSPLYYAAQSGQSDQVIALLAYGASTEDSSPLQKATHNTGAFGNYEEYIKTIKALLYAGIDAYFLNQTIAEYTSDENVKELLKNPLNIKHYCSPDEQNEFDYMMDQRRTALIKNNCNVDKQGNISKQLKYRELAGKFPHKLTLSSKNYK